MPGAPRRSRRRPGGRATVRDRTGPHDSRSLRVRLLFPMSMVAAAIGAGTLGYYALWRSRGGTWLDALFMTVTTITTIGYGEVRPLDSAGRIFTIFLAFVGIGSLFYTLSVIMEYLVSVRLADPSGRHRMERRISELTGHVIVAGLGRVGRQAALELAEAKTAFVSVDPSEAAERFAEANGLLFLRGNATEDPVLERAGIGRARGLIVTTGSDATNMYIVLSARVLNPQLRIVSRAMDEASITKLTRAGANRAISPYAIGGHRMAHLMLNPAVIDFFETALRKGSETLNIEDLSVPAESPAVGKSLETLDVRRTIGVTILAILRDGNPVVGSPEAMVVAPGDQLLALGTASQLARLERLIATGHAS